ncbi:MULTISPECIES: H-NS family nucleoid-associated regulatory protein [unclassified Polaromonas]|uniref:H-NS histone family protein n=1 Tax=unclassified Polaromonas TaxID=2638319 RepID=UPI0018CB2222|nr:MULTISPECIES: H-NS histone family protein [unclassified Polaromonas]MBG6074159.1 DNA-binding protein H-NS [Polaromonas sp. CG_9.7]MBG6116158.1 DNA-binding protein H-NS [Polaromonas sp. CG_9.2]MDH6186649.1 DNA-binding protein H-NS [Polaromonas sp. CG_23.6]
MDDLIKLRQQITEMEKQALELQKKNRPAVLAHLREQMTAYGITTEELGRAAPKPARPKAAPAKAATSAPKGKKPVSSAPAKYQGPDGQVWSGRGPAPGWLNALLVQGKTREDFLIQTDASASGSTVAE